MVEMEENTVMRQKFNRGIKTLVATKQTDNSSFMTVAEYRDRIHTVKVTKEKLLRKLSQSTYLPTGSKVLYIDS